MRKTFFFAVIVACSCSSLAMAEEATTRGKGEAAIRAAVRSYVTAFNRGNAQRLADHWSDDGEYITPTGERVQGREAIQAAFESLFAAGARPRVEIFELTVRFVTEDVAVEEGTARVISPGEAPSDSTYLAMHVKKDGKWRLHSVRETALPSPPSHYGQLQELEWMIGRWVDQSEHATVETVCQWTKNRNFITRSFKASVPGMDELEGTQVIGWDPASGLIRSWMFDSDGGFAEGVWSRDGNRWNVRTAQVLPDGKRGTSLNTIKFVDENTFTWQSTQRRIEGEELPDVEELPVVRASSEN